MVSLSLSTLYAFTSEPITETENNSNPRDWELRATSVAAVTGLELKLEKKKSSLVTLYQNP